MLRERVVALTPKPPPMQTDRAGPLRFVTQLCVRYAKRYIPDPFLYAVMLFVGVDANSCLEDCHPFSASRT